MKKDYDVIIIGAGIGGLICGTYLAKEGLKVLIVEQHFQPGGCCSAFKRRGFLFDAGAHIIGSAQPKETLGKVFADLKIQCSFIQMYPTDIIHFPSDRFEIPAGIHEFKEALCEQHKDEAENIQQFFFDVEQMTRPARLNIFIRKYSQTTYQEFLDSYFQNTRLKAILSAQCGFVGLPPNRLSALTAIFMFKSYNFEGSYYPEGSSQAFSNAIADAFQRFGGELKLCTKAEQILIKNDTVEGVKLQNGENVYSHRVISNADARQTYFALLNKNIRLDQKISEKLNDYEPSISIFMNYLGVDLKKNVLLGKNGWYHTSYDINQNFYKQGYIAIPTLFDSTLSNVEGNNVLIWYEFFPYEYNQISDWDKLKQEMITRSFDKISLIIPDIQQHIIVQEAATPRTLMRYTLNTDGAIYGWAQNSAQVFMNSFPSTSNINGLFLVGHWTGARGGIVPVAVSGMNIGKHVFNSFRNKTK